MCMYRYNDVDNGVGHGYRIEPIAGYGGYDIAVDYKYGIKVIAVRR